MRCGKREVKGGKFLTSLLKDIAFFFILLYYNNVSFVQLDYFTQIYNRGDYL